MDTRDALSDDRGMDKDKSNAANFTDIPIRNS